ncbi:MAG: cytochrome P450 [Pseudomonadota bacterium]
MTDVPVSDVDLYCDGVLSDPYPTYRALRDAGPVVWLERLQMFVVARYKEVKEALATPSVFISGNGVMMNQAMNDTLKGIVLCSDGAEHSAMRRVIMKPVTPGALRAMQENIYSQAEWLVDRLVSKETFDAATDLAQYLPVTIVSNLVGLPEEGREKMLEWAAANFNCFGALNDRAVSSFDTLKEMVSYALTQCVRGKLKPGSWAEMLHDAADRGDIPQEKASLMALDYMGPSLDTTIFATSNAIWLFATNPDQWDLVRENPSLIPSAINEVLRLESPIQGFSRFAVKEHNFDDLTVPAASRVVVLYASGNRDERKWDAPERFDVRRPGVGEHLGFGHGEHACIGMNLARMEITSLLAALAKRVTRFRLGESKRTLNNTLRGFERLEVTVN